MKKKIIISIIVLLLLSFILVLIIKNKQKINTIEIISTYDKPLVPIGFKQINDISEWENGFVIEDEIGNQFVWVPTIELLDTFIKAYEKYPEKLKKIKEQVDKYGGFYVSRFEAGLPIENQENKENISEETNDFVGIPLSKKNMLVWNFINYKNAEKSAELMYADNEYVSSEINNVFYWECIIKWLYNNYQEDEDTSPYGNFSNVNFRFSGYYSIDYGKNYKFAENKLKSQYNMILSTGATDRNMMNNMYDIFGNMLEYNKELYNNTHSERGGYYDNIGVKLSLSSETNIIKPDARGGFRIVLFQK